MTGARAWRLVVIATAALAMPLSASAQAPQAFDHASIAEGALNDFIRPGYQRLAHSAAGLEDALDAFCAKPSAEGEGAVRKHFSETLLAWSRVEALRFGPIVEEHRYERIMFWPDVRGIGLRQLSGAIAKRDSSLLNPESLAKKSVALQGLLALEYLLYGDRNDQLGSSTDAGRFRCDFAAAVAANVAKMAATVSAAWMEDSGIASAFLEPGPGKAYRSGKEVTQELLKAFTTATEVVRDLKIDRPLDDSPEEANPKRAAFWRSGLTIPAIVANVEGVRDLYAASHWPEMIDAHSPGMQDSLAFEFETALKLLAEIDQPIMQAATVPGLRQKLIVATIPLSNIRNTVGREISLAAGLSFGFNALDGD